MRITLFTLLMCLPIVFLSSQIAHDNKMYLYDYSPNQGYTTMGAIGQFIDLEKACTKKIELSQDDIQQFELMLNNIKSTRHYQMKLNGCFFSVYIKNGVRCDFLFCVNRIINLTNRKQYKIENTKYQKWVDDLLVKYGLRKI